MEGNIDNTMEEGFELIWHEQRLVLLGERAVWMPDYEVLLVADLHLGKESAFRAASIPVPDVTVIDLGRLSSLIDKTECRRLIILGDLVHCARGLSREVIDQAARWREEHRDLHVQLIVGNHDAKAGCLPTSWNLDSRDVADCGPFQLQHVPPKRSIKPCLAGHVHPKCRLRTSTDSMTLPCFVLTEEVLILPAFGTFVDGQAVKYAPARYFVISDDTITELCSPSSKTARLAK